MAGSVRRRPRPARLITRHGIGIVFAVTVACGALIGSLAAPADAVPVCFDGAGDVVPCPTVPPSTTSTSTTSTAPAARSTTPATTTAGSTTTTAAGRSTTPTTRSARVGGAPVLRTPPGRADPGPSSRTTTFVAIGGVAALVLLALLVPELAARRRRSAT